MTRKYDVYRITRGGVTTNAENVEHGEALLTVAIVLESYGDNWQLQPENPRGMWKILNTISNEWHIVVMLETELSRNQEDERRASKAQSRMNWLTRIQLSSELPMMTSDLNETPVDGYQEISDLVDGQEGAGV